jgi:hypothetical protein
MIPTGFNGRGRGLFERLRDVRDHIHKYELRCRPCHAKLDGFSVRWTR